MPGSATSAAPPYELTAWDLRTLARHETLAASRRAPHALDARAADLVEEVTRGDAPTFVYVIKYGAHFRWDRAYPASEAAFGARDAGLLLVYGTGAMAASQLLFVMGVRRIGIALASFHTNAAPFYVMLMMLALGGGWSWAQAAGAAIVAAVACGV